MRREASFIKIYYDKLLQVLYLDSFVWEYVGSAFLKFI